jgi:surfeit locus 1 family protein
MGPYLFKPRLLPTLATLAIFPVLVSLGVWQLHRAEEKQILLEQFESQARQAPIELSRIPDSSELRPYQKVVVSGRFLVDRQFYLDNKIYHGRAGYEVITPLRLPDRRVVLVNRGWIPQLGSRADLPSVVTPQEKIRLTGQVKFITGQGFSLGESGIKATAWPRLIQRVDVEEMKSVLGVDLDPLLILEDSASPAGFVRDWYIKKIQPQKNTSYAVQWFSMALVLLIIYFGVNMQRNEANG